MAQITVTFKGRKERVASILILCAIGMNYLLLDVAAQQRQPVSISLRGTVQSVKILKTSPPSVFIDIKLKMELVNTGAQPIIFLKREPLFVGAALARKPTDFVVGNILVDDGAWPANEITPEWTALRLSLDKPKPPTDETRILAPMSHG
jgi:hypothetical protein